jgi:diguanylate cyclase (GGDEF)-like protein
MNSLVAWIDRLTLRLWPSTQGELSDDVFADVISFMYSVRMTILSGSFGMSLTVVALAYYGHIDNLFYYNAFLLVPVVVVRQLTMLNFARLPAKIWRRDIGLHEARFILSSLAFFATLAVIFLDVIFHGSESDCYVITMIAVGNVMMNAARNAPFRRFVRVQTAIVIVPVVLGVFSMPGPLPKLLAFLILVLLKGVSEISQKIEKDTIAARTLIHHEQKMSRYDNLTGLANRRQFTEMLKRKLSEGLDISVLFLDLDRFKVINDTQGHPAGDELLCQIAERLVAVTDSKFTTVARIGGDEFVLMTTDEPRSAADRVMNIFTTAFVLKTGPAHVGCSIGINTTAMSRDAEDLIRNADIALYAAKAANGNAAVMFDAPMKEALERKAIIELKLRQAIEQDLVHPLYQPIVDMTTGNVVAAEALARWIDFELGCVSPEVFIKAAENLGLIEPLGEHILMCACMDAASWRDDIRVAVNVSPSQLKNPDRFKKAVIRALEVSGLPGHRLELEITEGAMIDDFPMVLDIILELKALEVRVALDDFGSGYSSLRYLERIPFDMIKIDRDLMLAAMNNKAQEIVIQMVAKIAGALNSSGVVVEGIETPEQRDLMLSLGINCAQGYLFGTPSADQGALMAPVVKNAAPTRAGIVSPRPFGAGARPAEAMAG